MNILSGNNVNYIQKWFLGGERDGGFLSSMFFADLLFGLAVGTAPLPTIIFPI